jgi:hypothetical protein
LLRVIGETDLDRIARQGEGDPIGDELRSIEAKLVRLQSARTRLLDALEQDDDPDIAERIKANRAEITRLQADQKRLLIESKQTSRNGIDLSDIQGRLAGASGDDLYRLRAEIAGELRRVVDVVKFWALPDRNRIVVEVKASRADRVAYVWIDGKFWQGYVVRKSEGFARLSPAKLDELIRTGKGPIALETLPLTPWQPETIHMRDIARSRASRVLNHST